LYSNHRNNVPSPTDPEILASVSSSTKVSAEEQLAIAAVMRRNPEQIRSNINLARLTNALLQRSEKSDDRVTNKTVAAAKTLKFIKTVLADIQTKASRPSTSSKPRPREKLSDDVRQRAVSFLEGYFTRDPRLFSNDKLTTVVLNKHLKLNRLNTDHFTTILVARLKRSATLKGVREKLKLDGTGQRKRWTRPEYLAALRSLNKHRGSFRQRLHLASSEADWKRFLPGRTLKAVATRLQLLYDFDQLKYDSKREEFYYDPDGEPSQDASHSVQLWNRPFLLESLANNVAEYGPDDPRSIADAIEDETGVTVSAQQVVAGLKTNRYLTFAAARH